MGEASEEGGRGERRERRGGAQSRLNVSRYANASSVFRAHSSPPDSNDSTISQI